MTEQDGFQVRLAAARDGEPAAWSELYHDVAPLVIGYLRAQRLSDAEDVAGEVLLEVVRDLHRFQGDADNLRSWVLAIAHHRLLDARRKAARRPRPAEPVVAHPTAVARDDPEAETLSALGFGRLEGLLASLTEDQRNVLLLRVVGDLSIAEVAAITGKRPGAVKQLQRRAVAVMRRQLEATDPPTPARMPTRRDVVVPVPAPVAERHLGAVVTVAGATAATLAASGLVATGAVAATGTAAATGGGLLLGAKIAVIATTAAVVSSGAMAATGTLPDPVQTLVADVAQTVSIELPRPEGPPAGVPGLVGGPTTRGPERGQERETPGSTGRPAPEPDRDVPDGLPADELLGDPGGTPPPAPDRQDRGGPEHPEAPPPEITPTAERPSSPAPSTGQPAGG